MAPVSVFITQSVKPAAATADSLRNQPRTACLSFLVNLPSSLTRFFACSAFLGPLSRPLSRRTSPPPLTCSSSAARFSSPQSGVAARGRRDGGRQRRRRRAPPRSQHCLPRPPRAANRRAQTVRPTRRGTFSAPSVLRVSGRRPSRHAAAELTHFAISVPVAGRRLPSPPPAGAAPAAATDAAALAGGGRGGLSVAFARLPSPKKGREDEDRRGEGEGVCLLPSPSSRAAPADEPPDSLPSGRAVAGRGREGGRARAREERLEEAGEGITKEMGRKDGTMVEGLPPSAKRGLPPPPPTL